MSDRSLGSDSSIGIIGHPFDLVKARLQTARTPQPSVSCGKQLGVRDSEGSAIEYFWHLNPLVGGIDGAQGLCTGVSAPLIAVMPMFHCAMCNNYDSEGPSDPVCSGDKGTKGTKEGDDEGEGSDMEEEEEERLERKRKRKGQRKGQREGLGGFGRDWEGIFEGSRDRSGVVSMAALMGLGCEVRPLSEDGVYRF
ncbi:MAG: hypothetical protein M1813_007080 [Trichoglossum hirsutum]|nr:MAG: hypothetical protein M1813_007080 [Trichoglossum hirsutum]